MTGLFLFLALYIILFIFTVLQETTFFMVFSLILVFLVASFFVIFLGFEFIGYLILIVYVGAIAVLFLFMVMLFDRAEYKIFNLDKFSLRFKIYSIIISFFLTFFLIVLFFFALENPLTENLSRENVTQFIGYLYCLELKDKNTFSHLDYVNKFFASYGDGPKIKISDIELVGLKLYNDFYLLLILGGLGLLVAMIGCIIITKSSFLSKKVRKNQAIENQLNRYKI